MVRAVGLLAAVFVALSPSAGFSQVAGIGINGMGGGGSQLGPPPAGVLLHQQYMQLYGLPTTFTQSQTNNGGGQGILPGYGGGGYPGGGGRFFGVNYQRNMMAAQAYMAQARYQQMYGNAGYGMQNGYAMNAPAAPSQSQTPANVGSFGMSQSRAQNPFLTTFSSQDPTETRFRGFGFANQQSFTGQLAPLSNREEDKKEEKK